MFKNFKNANSNLQKPSPLLNMIKSASRMSTNILSTLWNLKTNSSKIISALSVIPWKKFNNKTTALKKNTSSTSKLQKNGYLFSKVSCSMSDNWHNLSPHSARNWKCPTSKVYSLMTLKYLSSPNSYKLSERSTKYRSTPKFFWSKSTKQTRKPGPISTTAFPSRTAPSRFNSQPSPSNSRKKIPKWKSNKSTFWALKT